MNDASTLDALDIDGFVIVPNVFDTAFCQQLRVEIDRATQECYQIQQRKGVGNSHNSDSNPHGADGALGGAAHHVVCFGGVFLDLLEQMPLFDMVETYLGGTFVLNSFGAVTNTRINNMYEHGKLVHRDVRSFHPGFRQQCWLMVMVDEFTKENGATYILPGSQNQEFKPEDNHFYSNARQALGSAGSVVIFDGRLWHAAGRNITDFPRRALTISFTRPFIKPQLDYVRFFGEKRVEGMSENLKQLLGYYSRIPSNYDEWYQPPNQRMYRSNQG
ncbi:MAG: phytanoyl-CoA dioxygenase family protein [Pseudomonadales bacterium]|nr:phytanoyl-CoA dioxygenase family protein [Pseudomonadales bacterium]